MLFGLVFPIMIISNSLEISECFGRVQYLPFPRLDFSLLYILSYLFLYSVSLSEWIFLIKMLYVREENIDAKICQRENEYNKRLIGIKEGYTDL